MFPEKSQMKISIFQSEIGNDPRMNKRKMRKNIDKLNVESMDILCLPELSIYGFDYEAIKNRSEEEIREQDKFFSQLSEMNKIFLIAGSLEKHEDEYYDSVKVFDYSGDMIGKYRKIHLWSEEKEFFTQGNRLEIININGWKIGLGICADLGFPEMIRELARRDIDVFIFPSAWDASYEYLWELMIKARAAENQAYVVGCNACGDEYLGRSMVSDPSGEIIESAGVEEEVFTATLEKEKVESKRKEIPWVTMSSDR